MITLTREEAQQVLDALVFATPSECSPAEVYKDSIVLLQNRLAQPNPEPWAGVDFDIKTALPQRKEWQGLTDGEIMSLLPGAVRLPPGWADTARAIEAKLKEKNT